MMDIPINAPRYCESTLLFAFFHIILLYKSSISDNHYDVWVVYLSIDTKQTFFLIRTYRKLYLKKIYHSDIKSTRFRYPYFKF